MMFSDYSDFGYSLIQIQLPMGQGACETMAGMFFKRVL